VPTPILARVDLIDQPETGFVTRVFLGLRRPGPDRTATALGTVGLSIRTFEAVFGEPPALGAEYALTVARTPPSQETTDAGNQRGTSH
jgi:hypothetical protein